MERPPKLRPAPVSWTLLAVCVVAFLIQERMAETITVTMPDGEINSVTLPWGTLFGPAVRHGEWYRLLSYSLQHGGALHLLFNGSAIFSLGTVLERIIGSWRFVLVSIAGTLGCAAFGLIAHFESPLVGASGMILAWTGALLPILNASGRKQLMFMLVQVAVISLLPGISFAGHLGGFLFGVPFGFAMRKGQKTFAQAAPFLLFASAVAAVIASNPGKLFGP